MLDGEGQRFEKREHEASLELSRLPSAATATASAVAAVAPVQAPAPAPSPIEIAVSSAQQEAVLKKLGVTAELPSRALRCTLRGLTKEDCAVLSHCATRGPLVAAMPSLQLLDLGFNSIDDEGCAPWPQGLWRASSITFGSLHPPKMYTHFSLQAVWARRAARSHARAREAVSLREQSLEPRAPRRRPARARRAEAARAQSGVEPPAQRSPARRCARGGRRTVASRRAPRL